MIAYFHHGYLFMETLLRGGLDRALGQQLRHRLLLDLDHGVRGDLERQVVVVDAIDAAEDADGDDFVALRERLQHGLVLLRLPHLRPDHDEVEDDEHDHDGQHAHEIHAACGRCRSLGVRVADHAELRAEMIELAAVFAAWSACDSSMRPLWKAATKSGNCPASRAPRKPRMRSW